MNIVVTMNPIDQGRIHVRSMYVTECKERRIFFLQIIEYYRSNQEIIFINVLMNQCLLKLRIYTLVFFSYFTLRVFHDV